MLFRAPYRLDAPDTMHIQLNNQSIDVAADCSVAALVTSQQLDRPGVAVAVGNRVVPRDQWAQTMLQPDDKVVIIRAVCGG